MCSKKVIGGQGTKNSYIAVFQRYFWRDDVDESVTENNFLYGKSVSKQQTEAYWWQPTKSCTCWWMIFFKDLVETGACDTTNHIHTECMKFVLVTLRQRGFVTWLPFSFQIYDRKHSCCWCNKRNLWKELKSLESKLNSEFRAVLSTKE